MDSKLLSSPFIIAVSSNRSGSLKQFQLLALPVTGCIYSLSTVISGLNESYCAQITVKMLIGALFCCKDVFVSLHTHFLLHRLVPPSLFCSIHLSIFNRRSAAISPHASLIALCWARFWHSAIRSVRLLCNHIFHIDWGREIQIARSDHRFPVGSSMLSQGEKSC